MEQLLSGLDTRFFRSRDEEEVAGYAEAMNLVFASFQERIVSVHIKIFNHSTNQPIYKFNLSINQTKFDK